MSFTINMKIFLCIVLLTEVTTCLDVNDDESIADDDDSGQENNFKRIDESPAYTIVSFPDMNRQYFEVIHSLSHLEMEQMKFDVPMNDLQENEKFCQVILNMPHFLSSQLSTPLIELSSYTECDESIAINMNHSFDYSEKYLKSEDNMTSKLYAFSCLLCSITEQASDVPQKLYVSLEHSFSDVRFIFIEDSQPDHLLTVAIIRWLGNSTDKTITNQLQYSFIDQKLIKQYERAPLDDSICHLTHELKTKTCAATLQAHLELGPGMYYVSYESCRLQKISFITPVKKEKQKKLMKLRDRKMFMMECTLQQSAHPNKILNFSISRSIENPGVVFLYKQNNGKFFIEQHLGSMILMNIDFTKAKGMNKNGFMDMDVLDEDEL